MIWQKSINNLLFILVISPKRRYSSFLKMVFVFQKISFKVKVLRMFKMFIYCHITTCRSLNGGVFRTFLVPFSRWAYAFSINFKLKPLRKSNFQCLGKIQTKYCRILTEKSNQSFLLSIWWITFFKHLYSAIHDNGMYRT